jgi:heptosyltransferase-2
MSKAPPYSNILLRVPNWLGDTMMATPAVTAVRETFPKAKLSILAKPNFVPFWEYYPGVDQVIPLKGFWASLSRIRGQNFDAALTLPGSLSSAFLLFAAGIPVRAGWSGEGRAPFLTRVVPTPAPRQKHLVWEYLELVRQGLGKDLVPKTFQLRAPVGKETQAEADRLLKSLKVDPKKGLIAINPGATYGPAKRWPLPYWERLIEKLGERRESILVLGGPDESNYLRGLAKAKGRVFSLVGKTSPALLAAILERCRLLITNDTGPMHVAAGVGTPTVALFGSTSPTWTRPFGRGHEVLYKHVECSPCFQRTCPIGYVCLHGITVEEVHRAALKKLSGARTVQGERAPQGVRL